jgi:hypothetical protein
MKTYSYLSGSFTYSSGGTGEPTTVGAWLAVAVAVRSSLGLGSS